VVLLTQAGSVGTQQLQQTAAGFGNLRDGRAEADRNAEPGEPHGFARGCLQQGTLLSSSFARSAPAVLYRA